MRDLSWLVSQETGSVHGGILADTVRKGKTLLCVSLILTRINLVKTTLVVCPVSTVLEWYTDLDRFVAPEHKLAVLIYDSQTSVLLPSDMLQFDVVLTTYQSLDSENEKSRGVSLLQGVSWGRVILDDSDGVAKPKAVMGLTAEHGRIVVTEAPVTNRIDDLYELLQFLRFDPFGFLLCREEDCICKTREVDFEADKEGCCLKCGHAHACHTSQLREKISKPLIKGRDCTEGIKARLALAKDVLQAVVLQPRDETHLGDDLPQFSPRWQGFSGERLKGITRSSYPPLRMNTASWTVHSDLWKEAKVKFGKYAKTGAIMANFTQIFDLLEKLRQASQLPLMEASCVLCADRLEAEEKTAGATSCKHIFHKTCLETYIETAPEMAFGGVGCPVCMTRLTDVITTERKDEERALKKAKLDGVSECAKLEKLVEVCTRFLEKDPSSKILVFSQFSQMLSMAQERLRTDARLSRSVRLVGDMSLEDRKSVIDEFNRDCDLKVMFIPLKPGFLRFTVKNANRMVLLEPCGSPDLEKQAIETVGHFSESSYACVRLVWESSIEERILELQQRKSRLSKIRRQLIRPLEWLTIEDIRFLFE